MKAQSTEEQERFEFYSKLFQALEFSTGKEEAIIIKRLFKTFRFPGKLDPVKWFTDHQSPERVMGWLMHEVEPFAQMLESIYNWLAEIEATAVGNIDEVTFNFAALEEQVPFSLKSFPKTYLRLLRDQFMLRRSFDPGAKGRLRVEYPNFWANDVHALSNLSHSRVLYPDVFDKLSERNKAFIIARVQQIVAVLDGHYIRKTAPDVLDLWLLFEQTTFYVRSEDLWAKVLHIVATAGADDGAASELFALLDRCIYNGEMVHADGLLGCLAHGARYELDTDFSEELNPDLTEDDLEKDDVYAFLCAYELCFPSREVSIRTYVDIVDRVLLPFWKHRWRLFEIWAILWLRQTLPEQWQPIACLSRSEPTNNYEWSLPGGDAKQPVARIRKSSCELSVWFQLKTPLSKEDAARFRQENIEPDLRLRGQTSDKEVDLVILELKDRHLAGGSEEKRVARMYATTQAKVVCVANYSFFRSESLLHKIYTERVNESAILIVGNFKPGNVPEELEQVIRETIGKSLAIDILLDVSGSMVKEKAIDVLDRLLETGIVVERWFVWADDFREVIDRSEATRSFSTRGTRLETAVDSYSALKFGERHRAILLTDRDGVEQFGVLKQRGIIDDSEFFCIDVMEDVDTCMLDEWLFTDWGTQ